MEATSDTNVKALQTASTSYANKKKEGAGWRFAGRLKRTLSELTIHHPTLTRQCTVHFTRNNYRSNPVLGPKV